MPRRAGRLGLAALLLGVAGPASGADTLVLRPPGEVVGLASDAGIGSGIAQGPSGISAVFADGRRRAIRLSGGALRLGPPVAPDAAGARPAGILPDGEIAGGGGGIRRAWLSDPTDRYGHGVLGDAIEAGALVLEDAAGVAHRHALGAASVFEDRRVRLHDLDGDGRDEAIVVRSYLGAGAALAVFALDGAGVRHLAEIPPIGRPNRWLNPAGAGDFDGDGAVELAFVETPHIGGTLRLYELRGGALTADGAARGFSNHAIGTRELGMSAVLDWNGDGVPDLAVPDTGRTSVRLVSFAAGVFAEIDRVAHGQPIASALLPMAAADGRVHLVYALLDGTLAAAAPSR